MKNEKRPSPLQLALNHETRDKVQSNARLSPLLHIVSMCVCVCTRAYVHWEMALGDKKFSVQGSWFSMICTVFKRGNCTKSPRQIWQQYIGLFFWICLPQIPCSVFTNLGSVLPVSCITMLLHWDRECSLFSCCSLTLLVSMFLSVCLLVTGNHVTCPPRIFDFWLNVT